ncbi:MAG: NlpC/P60 family protein [Bilophila sp.]
MNATTSKTPVFLVFLLLAGLVVSGCSTRKTSISDSTAEGYGVERIDRESMTSAERFTYDYRSAALARMQEDDSTPLSKEMLIKTAKTAIGTPYVPGGESTDGFDCSGFVQWAYKHVGVKLPRTAREQATAGTPVRKFEDMVAGDIVAFKHPRRGYHTGIYVGDGKFIHSPRKRTRVRINSLDDPYFSSTFLGARRIDVDDNDLEAAQTLLAAYESQKGRLHQTRTDAQPSKKAVVSERKASKKAGLSRKALKKAEKSTKNSPSSRASKASKVDKASKSAKATQATRSSQATNKKSKSKAVASVSQKKTERSSKASTSKPSSSKVTSTKASGVKVASAKTKATSSKKAPSTKKSSSKK